MSDTQGPESGLKRSASVTASRPNSGDTKISQVRVTLCAQCFCVIDGDLCSYGCSLDGDSHGDGQRIVAVYERCDTFLRDEVAEAPMVETQEAPAESTHESNTRTHLEELDRLIHRTDLAVQEEAQYDAVPLLAKTSVMAALYQAAALERIANSLEKLVEVCSFEL